MKKLIIAMLFPLGLPGISVKPIGLLFGIDK